MAPTHTIALAALALALCGCPDSPAHTREDRLAAVRDACARCHRLPPPSALPKERWPERVKSMATYPLPPGVTPLSDDELALATAYYAEQAPEALAALEPAPADARLKFEVEGFHPKAKAFAERIPATANVAFVPLSDPRRRDLLICELRSKSLFLLAPWAPREQRAIRGLAKELDYPAHAQLVDVNGDGRDDLLIGALGAINPTNESVGAVWLLPQDERRRFGKAQLLGEVGRVSDARAADVDGDGDVDVIAAAFGWRGPGGLHLLEQRDGAFVDRALDDRDGFVHAEAVDLDGDGQPEIVAVLAQEHEQVLAFTRDGDAWTPRVLHQAEHPGWGTSGLQVVDLDGDGRLDLLVSNGDALDDAALKPYHGVAWLRNRGELEFAYERIGALYGCERAVAADLDGDGDQDVVAVSFLPHLPPERWEGLDSVVWFERADGGWRPWSLERGRCVHPTLDAADYDGDGDVDLAVGNYVWLVEDNVPSTRADAVTLFTQQR